jgi:hypothetical protein
MGLFPSETMQNANILAKGVVITVRFFIHMHFRPFAKNN